MIWLWLTNRHLELLLFLELGCYLFIVRLINLLPRISYHNSFKRLQSQVGFFGRLAFLTCLEWWILWLRGWWQHFHYLVWGFDRVLMLEQSHLVSLIKLLEILVHVRVANSRNFGAGVGGAESVHPWSDIQIFLNEAIWVLKHFLFKSFDGDLSRGPNLFVVKLISCWLCFLANRSYFVINLSCVNLKQLF